MPVSERTNIKYENGKTIDALMDLKMGEKVLAYWPVLEDLYLAEVVQICLKETFHEYVILIIETLLILLIIYFIQLQLERLKHPSKKHPGGCSKGRDRKPMNIYLQELTKNKRPRVVIYIITKFLDGPKGS